MIGCGIDVPGRVAWEVEECLVLVEFLMNATTSSIYSKGKTSWPLDRKIGNMFAVHRPPCIVILCVLP